MDTSIGRTDHPVGVVVPGKILFTAVWYRAKAAGTGSYVVRARSPQGMNVLGGAFRMVNGQHPDLRSQGWCARAADPLNVIQASFRRVSSVFYTSSVCDLLGVRFDLPPGARWLRFDDATLISPEYAWLLELWTDTDRLARMGSIADQLIPAEPIQPLVLLDLVPGLRLVDSPSGSDPLLATFETEADLRVVADSAGYRLPPDLFRWLLARGAKTMTIRLVVDQDFLPRRFEVSWDTAAGHTSQVVSYSNWGEPVDIQAPDPVTVATPDEAGLLPSFHPSGVVVPLPPD